MNKIKSIMALMLVTALASFGMVVAQAQYQRPYRVSDQQVENIIRRVENRTSRFRRSLDTALDRSRLDGTEREDQINAYMKDFESATSNLRERFNNRRSVSRDVEDVLNRASSIDVFMRNNNFNRRTENDWLLVKRELDSLASTYSVAWNWNSPVYPGGNQPYRLSDREVEQIIRRVETSSDTFRRSLDTALDRSRLDGTEREDQINRYVRDFDAATGTLREHFNDRRSVSKDVEDVLRRASYIDAFMTRRRLDVTAERDWVQVKRALDTLSGAYSVAWNWNNPGNTGPVYGTDARLTGTYTLDTRASQDARNIAERAVRNLPYSQRQTTLDNLLSRLATPNMIAIERRGQSVLIASSNAPQVSLEADGRDRVETYPNGRTSSIRSTISGDKLMIKSTGDRVYDFDVTFDPLSTNRLTVMRTVYAENLTQPVTVTAYYNKTSDVAQWNVYNGSPIYTGSTGTTIDKFIVPNGTQIVAVLNNDLSTKTANDNDRFTMTVQGPSQYQGATIEGYVSNVKRSGRVTGRSEMTFNFERIRLLNGNSYEFAGFIDTVNTANGETVRVDNEGAIKEGDSRTTTTATRTAIGTAVGAIIGAIAGGGKGAAIGAVVGAGAGAGSVFVQGRDDLELMSGSEVKLTATGPQ